jgi:hypothetical protein
MRLERRQTLCPTILLVAKGDPFDEVPRYEAINIYSNTAAMSWRWKRSLQQYFTNWPRRPP